MTFRDLRKSDARATVMNLADWAEQVTYKPKASAAKTISAVVDRRPRAVETSMGGIRTRSAGVRILNDATYGITKPALEDLVTLVLDPGQAARECRVTSFEPGGEEFWRLEVTA